MAAKNILITIALACPFAHSMQLDGSSNFSSDLEVPHLTLTAVAANDTANQEIASLETVFARSDDAHKQSMDKISKDLTLPKAIQAIQQSSLTNLSSLKQITDFIAGSGNLRAQKLDGFGGLDGARKLLNDMILESATKYDAEIAKCTDYYAKQCAMMEVARGQISAANYIAATSRALILDAQSNINRCEILLPETKLELKDHDAQCKDDLYAMNKHLETILNDIEVMTMILEMSDCDAKLLQTNKLVLLRCKDRCSNKNYITFNHKDLQRRLNQLQSPLARSLFEGSFADFFTGEDGDIEAADSVKFVQVNDSQYEMLQFSQDPEIDDMPQTNETNETQKTKFNNPPVPKTKVPSNPCTDPDAGAPSQSDKRAAKCTLKKSPRCYKLQGRFLQIQAAIADQRDQLMEDLQKKDTACLEMKNSLESSIENDQALLQSSQTKLAAATEKEAAAGENGRQVAMENEQYHADLLKQMKSCSTNYVDFETELCALKKIRGDLFKKMKAGHTGFFQDCELSKWTPEACSKKCAGGEQKLVRSVLQHPNGGAKCLPLTAEKSCNLKPCPVDCVQATWGGWSKCSAKCGGGVQQRTRDIKVAMKYNGKACSASSATRACNIEACEKDCVLHEWTRWTGCSKDCDGGTRKRVRMVKEPAEGAGKCAGQWHESRLEYMQCNMRRCKAPPGEALKCKSKLDVILLLDGTPKSGESGWHAEVKAANFLVDAFTITPGRTRSWSRYVYGRKKPSKPNFAVIHYTGPRTWSGVSKCTGTSTEKVDMERTCRVKIAQHFTDDMSKVKGTINRLQYAPGSKLLSLALMTTQSELALGRSDARTVVIVFVDGEPLSYRKTYLTSRNLRKKARVVYVPVTKFSPLANIKTWASRRWQENVVVSESVEEWTKPDVVTHIVANICPNKHPKLKSKRHAWQKIM